MGAEKSSSSYCSNLISSNTKSNSLQNSLDRYLQQYKQRFDICNHPLYKNQAQIKLLYEKMTKKLFILRTLSTNDYSQKQTIVKLIKQKLALKVEYLTKLQYFQYEQTMTYCSQYYHYHLIFNLSNLKTLKEYLLSKKVAQNPNSNLNQNQFDFQQLNKGLHHLIKAIAYLKYFDQSHSQINTNSIYINYDMSQFILTDPWISPLNQVQQISQKTFRETYPSPQKLHCIFKNNNQIWNSENEDLSINNKYDQYANDLFAIGMSILQLISINYNIQNECYIIKEKNSIQSDKSISTLHFHKSIQMSKLKEIFSLIKQSYLTEDYFKENNFKQSFFMKLEKLLFSSENQRLKLLIQNQSEMNHQNINKQYQVKHLKGKKDIGQKNSMNWPYIPNNDILPVSNIKSPLKKKFFNSLNVLLPDFQSGLNQQIESNLSNLGGSNFQRNQSNKINDYGTELQIKPNINTAYLNEKVNPNSYKNGYYKPMSQNSELPQSLLRDGKQHLETYFKQPSHLPKKYYNTINKFEDKQITPASTPKINEYQSIKYFPNILNHQEKYDNESDDYDSKVTVKVAPYAQPKEFVKDINNIEYSDKDHSSGIRFLNNLINEDEIKQLETNGNSINFNRTQSTKSLLLPVNEIKANQFLMRQQYSYPFVNSYNYPKSNELKQNEKFRCLSSDVKSHHYEQSNLLHQNTKINHTLEADLSHSNLQRFAENRRRLDETIARVNSSRIVNTSFSNRISQNSFEKNHFNNFQALPATKDSKQTYSESFEKDFNKKSPNFEINQISSETKAKVIQSNPQTIVLEDKRTELQPSPAQPEAQASKPLNKSLFQKFLKKHITHQQSKSSRSSSSHHKTQPQETQKISEFDINQQAIKSQLIEPQIQLKHVQQEIELPKSSPQASIQQPQSPAFGTHFPNTLQPDQSLKAIEFQQQQIRESVLQTFANIPSKQQIVNVSVELSSMTDKSSVILRESIDQVKKSMQLDQLGKQKLERKPSLQLQNQQSPQYQRASMFNSAGIFESKQIEEQDLSDYIKQLQKNIDQKNQLERISVEQVQPVQRIQKVQKFQEAEQIQQSPLKQEQPSKTATSLSGSSPVLKQVEKAYPMQITVTPVRVNIEQKRDRQVVYARTIPEEDEEESEYFSSADNLSKRSEEISMGSDPFWEVPRKQKLKSYQIQGQYIEQQYENGGKYQGYTINGQRNGLGKFCYRDGGYYYGMWKNNMMCGQGQLYYDNGKIAYDGQWYRDEFHGQGKVYNDSAYILVQQVDYRDVNTIIETYWTYYEGQLSHDTKVGYGKIMLSNGQYYIGQFRNDNVHGKGKFYSMSNGGQLIRGVWKDGVLIKQLAVQQIPQQIAEATEVLQVIVGGVNKQSTSDEFQISTSPEKSLQQNSLHLQQEELINQQMAEQIKFPSSIQDNQSWP